MAPIQSRFNFKTIMLTTTTILSLTLNALQALIAILIMVLIGANYNAPGTEPDHSDAIYTIIICVLSLITAAILAVMTLIPPSSRVPVLVLLAWQCVLVVLWAAATGVMVGRYITDMESTGGLKAAAVLTIIEFMLWAGGATAGLFVFFCSGRRMRKKVAEQGMT